MLTIEGIELSLPIFPASPNNIEPTTDPNIIAKRASRIFEV